MTTQYIIAPEALEDLKAIASYFSQINVETGEKLIDEFQKKCRYLVQFPQIGRSYKEIRPYLRGLPLDGYIIFYRLGQNIALRKHIRTISKSSINTISYSVKLFKPLFHPIL